MTSLGQILTLIHKDILIEWRQRYALAGVLLFAIGIVFILFKSFGQIDARNWSVLLWVVALFGGINAVVKAFVQEKSGTYLYYYTLVSPGIFYVAKLVYNIGLMLLLITLVWVAFTIFGGNMVKDWPLFGLAICLGAVGLGTVFTFISSISSLAGQGATVMSILSIPLVLPILLLLIKITSVAMRLIIDSAIYDEVWMLAAICGIQLGISLILFPQVWKG